MPMKSYEIVNYIKERFPDAIIEIKDLVGDNDHWFVYVQSASFIGKTRVQQHKMVYSALKDNMNSGTLHALQLKTKAL